ncbi:DUF1624 domain-containing protein [Pelagibacterium sp. 26DY04]|uniref:DUF1624 domain-containing protein n=1 Tax=Pelagibacterium sp. 26DY04 TaxID=2967130 RepID=UPI0028163567|nr:heparan-alpha-glucosaminide N-acetyltransferase [Pelagibacterium sp. 26DY04]WMT88423.1 DUF1624 domain-containing protein [Pelagibacterium sp. 26DY04]
MTEIAPASRPRIAAVDIARGIAIVAMVIYHFSWDLAFLGFVDFDPTQSLPWIVFQKSIVGTFIFLTGVSLVLGHGAGIRWPAFWRRFAIILGAALLVTAGTYTFYAETFVYFGVLHAIALFSLLGLVFLRAPLALVIVPAIAISLLPLFVQDPLFGEKLWSWIGLWDVPPPTEDLVPIFPWFGVALAGIAAARLALASGFATRLAEIQGTTSPARFLARMGRWSLVIYVLHQPIMIGVLMGISSLTGVSEANRANNFLASCEATCGQSAPDQSYCTAYCACTLDRIEGDSLWAMLEAPERTPDQDATLQTLANQCATQVLDERLLAP